MVKKEIIEYQKELRTIVNNWNDPNEEYKFKGAWLMGEMGIGKTYTFDLLHEFINYRNEDIMEDNIFSEGKKEYKMIPQPVRVNFSDLVRSIKEGIGKFKDSPLYQYRNVDFLIIDDIGAEGIANNISWYIGDILYSFFNYRMELESKSIERKKKQLPTKPICTIFISNLSIDQYKQKFIAKGGDDLDIKRLFTRIDYLAQEKLELTGKNKRRQ